MSPGSRWLSGFSRICRYPISRVSANNYVFSDTSAFARDLYAARIDRTINEKHSFFGRFTTENRHQADPNFLGSIASNSRTIHDTFYNATANEVWIVSPSIVNNIRYGYTRAHAHQVLVSEGTDPADTLGLPAYIAQAGPVAAFPDLQFQQRGSAERRVTGRDYERQQISGGGNNQPRDTQTVADSLTWIRGPPYAQDGRRIPALSLLRVPIQQSRWNVHVQPQLHYRTDAHSSDRECAGDGVVAGRAAVGHSRRDFQRDRYPDDALPSLRRVVCPG